MPRPHVGTRASSFWTDQKVSEALEALRASYTLDEAAQRIGVTVPALQSMCTQRRAALGGTAASFLRTSAAEKRDPMREAREVAERVVQRSAGEREPLLPPITRPEPLPPMSTGTARVRRSVERILFIPDVHVPFEDRRAWDLMMHVARALRPEHIVILGDFADMWAVSAHDKSPSRRDNLESEMKAVAIRLDELDALGARTRIFCEGNHEDRLSRYITRAAPELFDFVSFPKIQRLEERGWRWVPYREHARIGKVFVTHDLGEAGIYAHNRARATMGGNVVIGHVHRMGVAYASTAEGTGHVSAAFGWLGDAEQARYLPAARRAAWQLGFGLGYMEPATGHVHLQAVPIVDYRCVVEGALFGEGRAA